MRSRHDDARVWATAQEQKWLIKHAQLEEFGFSRGAIAHRLERARLWLVYRHVYAVGNPEMTPDRQALAAVLACGDPAALSDHSAAVLLGLREGRPPRRQHVSILDRRDIVVPDGITLHRPRLLLPEEIIVHDGVPVTSVSRTIVDNAATLGPRGIRSMIRQAERVHQFDLQTLQAYVDERPPTSSRHARVRRVLRDYLPAAAATDTEREALMFDICARYGLPQPKAQEVLLSYRVDFLWPDCNLIVELDDRGSHDTAVAFTEDRVRDRVLLAAGYVVMRFTVTELQRRPARVAREIAGALSRLRNPAA